MKSLLKKIIVSILTLEARAVLAKYNPRIVAITGSVGKTSTKDAIAAVLSATHSVRKSTKSYNSEIGVPLTILGCENAWNSPLGWLRNFLKGLRLILFPTQYESWLVLEVGADHPGDISRLTRWLHPDVVVVTRIGERPVHREHFSSREELVAEKSNLPKALREKGTLVLNYDDEDVSALSRLSKGDTLFYGFHSHAHIVASNDAIEYDPDGDFQMPSGLSVKINYSGNAVPVTLKGSLGKQHIYPLLAAAAVGIDQGMNLIAISQSLRNHTPPPGRMRLIYGFNQSLIIDDSYNSSPVAAYEAVEVLREVHVPYRRIAVLGDMKELGEESADAHRELGTRVSHVCDLLVTVGPLAAEIAAGAKRSGMAESSVMEFSESHEAGKTLLPLLEPGDVVLVKGSQSIRCESVVAALMREPERAGELLVRQEKEWKAR